VRTRKRTLRKPRLKRLHYLHPVKGRFEVVPCRILEVSPNWITLAFLDENGEIKIKALVVSVQLSFEEPHDAHDQRYVQWDTRVLRVPISPTQLLEAVQGQSSDGSEPIRNPLFLFMGCMESLLLSFTESALQLARWNCYHVGELPLDSSPPVVQTDELHVEAIV
jgi:hypothetical protein